MKVRVTKRAQAQIDQTALWWDENRVAAPEAFDEDLAEAFLLLSAEPGVGAPALNVRAEGVRRLHLARIRCHLYYRVRGSQVEVLALWHTSRGRGPSLQLPAMMPDPVFEVTRRDSDSTRPASSRCAAQPVRESAPAGIMERS